MNSLEKTEAKVKFIVGMFKFSQTKLTIVEQIALLTVWEESCVIQEEYEIAGALKKEMKKIQENPFDTPQKNILQVKPKDITDDPINITNKKEVYTPFYVKLFNWFKGLFRKKS